jgi:hypothetical protein
MTMMITHRADQVVQASLLYLVTHYLLVSCRHPPTNPTHQPISLLPFIPYHTIPFHTIAWPIIVSMQDAACCCMHRIDEADGDLVLNE